MHPATPISKTSANAGSTGVFKTGESLGDMSVSFIDSLSPLYCREIGKIEILNLWMQSRPRSLPRGCIGRAGICCRDDFIALPTGLLFVMHKKLLPVSQRGVSADGSICTEPHAILHSLAETALQQGRVAPLLLFESRHGLLRLCVFILLLRWRFIGLIVWGGVAGSRFRSRFGLGGRPAGSWPVLGLRLWRWVRPCWLRSRLLRIRRRWSGFRPGGWPVRLRLGLSCCSRPCTWSCTRICFRPCWLRPC